jgi:hypothetical protein
MIVQIVLFGWDILLVYLSNKQYNCWGYTYLRWEFALCLGIV